MAGTTHVEGMRKLHAACVCAYIVLRFAQQSDSRRENIPRLGHEWTEQFARKKGYTHHHSLLRLTLFDIKYIEPSKNKYK